jgi:PAS domain S-box-containing protein
MSCAFLVCDALAHDTPIIYCSESFEKLTGYSQHEIIGQNCRFLQSSDGKVEAGIPRVECDDLSVFFLKNSLVKGTEAQISIINYKKGGHPFMNLLTMIPIMDKDNKVYQFVGFQVDIVESPDALNSKGSDGSLTVNYQRPESLRPYMRSAQEQGLMGDYGQTLTPADVTRAIATLATSTSTEQSERMFEKVLLDNADDVIYVLSLKGLFLYVSPSCRRVLEYEPSELIGNSLSSVCHPSDIVPVTRELKDSQIESSISVVFRVHRKNSGYAWFESYGSLQTERGKSRKCIILVGRERPVYTLTKTNIAAAGGIDDHEMWSKMSTAGMFLYISGHVKSLIDHQPEELVGTNIQALMRQDSRAEFERVLSLALTGQCVQVKHELINRRGQVVQAHSWLYPGDATEGHKPSFLVAQTRLIKYTRSSRKPDAPQSSAAGGSSQRLSGGASSGATPQSGGSSSAAATTGGNSGRAVSTPTTVEPNLRSTPGTAASGVNRLPVGRQDAQLASAENIFDELKTTRSSSWQFELRQLERRNRALADEVQRLAAARKKRKRRRGGAGAEGLLVKDCVNCHATETPEWRRGPSGNRDLCNSCGLRWAKQVRSLLLRRG